VRGPRLFAVFAIVSMLPVLALGIVLVNGEHASGVSTGLDQGRAQAATISKMVVAPALDGHDLGTALTRVELTRLHSATDLAVLSGSLTAMRLRSFAGTVQFSDNGATTDAVSSTDPGFQNAANGATVVAIAASPYGGDERSIRVLEPVIPSATGQAAGVLELYLPYGPIEASIRAEQHRTYLRLGGGLLALYLVLAAISSAATRPLRRYAATQERQARHDSLTGLPNRARFKDQAERILADPRSKPGAVVVLDLTRFKEVNDTLGHHAGDALLTVVARRLSESLRTDDLVARLGGDEFGLVLTGLSEASVVKTTLAALQAVLSAELVIDDTTLTIEASFGAALYPAHSREMSELLRYADEAMYQGKRGADHIVIWKPETASEPTHWLELHSELRRALNRDELVLHYQPKIDLTSLRVCGLEALVRWQHPVRGLLGPSEFLPAVENSSLIQPLTMWVLSHALADQADWLRRGVRWPVSVNVSARNFELPEFAGRVIELVQTYGTSDLLILELTETALAADPVTAEIGIRALSDAGIGVSLDDFGTGYTSLMQLRSLPVSEIKIDAVFVNNLGSNEADRQLVRAMVDLAHGIGCRVIAEGVAEAKTASWLASIGCDAAQGYHFARPSSWQSALERFGPDLPAGEPAGTATIDSRVAI
jgi:diguanylate cyclase (GGDEF)-like protein